MSNFTHEVEHMCPVTKGAKHGPAPIPQEGKWTKATKIEDINGFYPRCRLVRTTTGSVQTDTQC